MKNERIGVLITAAGMSKRMGRTKQLLKINGKTFLEHILMRFSSVNPAETVIVTGYQAEEVRKSLKDRNVTFLHNENYETTHMFKSVCIGLEYLQDRCDRLFFLPVDVPLFQEETLFEELACTQNVILPIASGRIGHPVLIRTSVIPHILQYDGHRGLKGALDELPKKEICYLPVDDFCCSMDADTPEDLQRLLSMAETRPHRAAVFGAGQAGLRLVHLLSNDIKICAFLDNDTAKQGTSIRDIPVVAPEKINDLSVDRVYLAALNPKRQKEQKQQLKELGYSGRIIPLKDVRNDVDLRLALLRRYAEMIRERNIEGDCCELGVFRGEFAAEISRCLPERKLYLFDTFEGFAKEDLDKETVKPGICPDFSDTSVETVLSVLPHPENAVIVKGRFPDSLENTELPEKLCFVSLDADLYEPTIQGLNIFWQRLSDGGMILINDCDSLQFPSVSRAVGEFCRDRGLYVIPLNDLHGSAILLKQAEGND